MDALSFSVSQRVQEIGIRMALGARPRSIVLLVVRQATLAAALGLVIGIVLSSLFVRMIGAQLAALNVSNAGGPMTFVVVSLLLLAVAQLASFLPARRATRVDPLAALRHDSLGVRGWGVRG